MIYYVTGFMFSLDQKRVVLIEKDGIGGALEPGEGMHASMCQKFKEKTDIFTTIYQWVHKISLWREQTQTCTHFFAAFSDLPEIKNEQVIIVPIEKVSGNWIIPFCLDPDIKEYVNVHAI